jgi:toxin ParE1/3/4
VARRLVHDRAAQDDLVEIWVYSFRNWGEEQAERYLDALEHGISAIAADPQSGQRRDEIREGYWSVRVEQHVVFYSYSDTEVRIRRALHGAMDPGRHL